MRGTGHGRCDPGLPKGDSRIPLLINARDFEGAKHLILGPKARSLDAGRWSTNIEAQNAYNLVHDHMVIHRSFDFRTIVRRFHSKLLITLHLRVSWRTNQKYDKECSLNQSTSLSEMKGP